MFAQPVNVKFSKLTTEQGLPQILFNLIGNAIKFTENGSDNNKRDLVFSIEDSGRGISEDQLEFIFEEFRQQEGQNVKDYGGAGLLRIIMVILSYQLQKK